MNILVLPIEVKKREFYPKLYLAYQILKKNKNFSIIIGAQSDLAYCLNIYNSIYLDKGSASSVTHLIKKYKNNNNIIYQVDEEGPIFSMSHFERKTRYSKNVIKLVDKFFLWGKKDLLFFKKSKKTSVIGHYKFDFIKNLIAKENKVFNKEQNKIKKKFKNYVLFASSFNEDHILDKKIYFKYLKSFDINNQININQTIFKEDYHNQNYFYAIKLIKEFSIKNPKINIVFRPHPVQDIQKVKKRFIGYKNIHVNKSFSITPWIQECLFYIHSGCTTVLEALILKKKVFLIRKNNSQNIFDEIGEKFKNINNLNFRKLNFQNNKKVYLKTLIENFDRHNLFTDKFSINLVKINNLDSYYELTNKDKINLFSYFKPFVSFFKNFTLVSLFLGHFIDPRYYLSKRYKQEKIEKINKNEIVNFFKYINIKKSIRSVSIKHIKKNIYLLKNQNV